MTFLCTVEGELVPGNLPDGEPRTILHDGVEFYDWPTPWAQRCDRCQQVFDYATCVAGVGGIDFCVDCAATLDRERRAERKAERARTGPQLTIEQIADTASVEDAPTLCETVI